MSCPYLLLPLASCLKCHAVAQHIGAYVPHSCKGLIMNVSERSIFQKKHSDIYDLNQPRFKQNESDCLIIHTKVQHLFMTM